MYRYTSLEEDLFTETNSNSQDYWLYQETSSNDPSTSYIKYKQPLREKNSGKKHSGYKHVPHGEKPPIVVEKRNARERRRVQAVNSAFVRLRNAVPIQNTRGKRISKVKTLLYAMEYIRTLDTILKECESYTNCYEMVKPQQNKDIDFETCSHWAYGEEITVQTY